MKRICIYAKDISMITGKSYRQSLRIYKDIKRIHNKKVHQEVSISELAQYLGLKEEVLQKYL